MIENCKSVAHICVRHWTVCLATWRAFLWTLQPCHREIAPCWLFNKINEPRDLRLEQEHCTSNRLPSTGTSPLTQNRRQPPETHTTYMKSDVLSGPIVGEMIKYDQTCVSALLLPINDHSSLEQLQKTGRLLPFYYEHLRTTLISQCWWHVPPTDIGVPPLPNEKSRSFLTCCHLIPCEIVKKLLTQIEDCSHKFIQNKLHKYYKK